MAYPAQRSSSEMPDPSSWLGNSNVNGKRCGLIVAVLVLLLLVAPVAPFPTNHTMVGNNLCVSAKNLDLARFSMAAGNADRNACAAQCMASTDSSAFEWFSSGWGGTLLLLSHLRLASRHPGLQQPALEGC